MKISMTLTIKNDWLSIANKYIANALSASGINNTINNAQNRSNEAQAYWGARANQQRDMVMGNHIKPAVWEQPDPLKPVRQKFKSTASSTISHKE